MEEGGREWSLTLYKHNSKTELKYYSNNHYTYAIHYNNSDEVNEVSYMDLVSTDYSNKAKNKYYVKNSTKIHLKKRKRLEL